MPPARRVALVTLGCARNEVDSEELAARLEDDGWSVVPTPAEADAVVVNTCGFVDAAKRESVDTLLGLAGEGRTVVAVGCLAERYGEQLAEVLPEADAVLGFDDYPDIAERLRRAVAGEPHVPHAPRDRRLLLPVTPVDRPAAERPVPGHASLRHRLETGPTAPLKLASGCDRRCSFCAIPSFRGSYVSRRPHEILDEARWLAGEGVREIVLVSENSTSYGKDLGDMRLLEALLPELAAVEGIERVRVSYLQPAEVRPALLDAMAATPGVTGYFDLSFQHASTAVLRRMRRFGGTESFLALLEQIRDRVPTAGVRSNVIVGFPGETEDDLAELERFLGEARMDAVGVFGYSDEEGTEAVGLDGHLPEHEIRARADRVSMLVDELCAQRAEERIGSTVTVLVESVGRGSVGGGSVGGGSAGGGSVGGVPYDGGVEGRAEHQGPEDGRTTVVGVADAAVGDLVVARVEGTDGVDLVARAGGPA